MEKCTKLDQEICDFMTPEMRELWNSAPKDEGGNPLVPKYLDTFVRDLGDAIAKDNTYISKMNGELCTKLAAGQSCTHSFFIKLLQERIFSDRRQIWATDVCRANPGIVGGKSCKDRLPEAQKIVSDKFSSKEIAPEIKQELMEQMMDEFVERMTAAENLGHRVDGSIKIKMKEKTRLNSRVVKYLQAAETFLLDLFQKTVEALPNNTKLEPATRLVKTAIKDSERNLAALWQTHMQPVETLIRQLEMEKNHKTYSQKVTFINGGLDAIIKDHCASFPDKQYCANRTRAYARIPAREQRLEDIPDHICLTLADRLTYAGKYLKLLPKNYETPEQYVVQTQLFFDHLISSSNDYFTYNLVNISNPAGSKPSPALNAQLQALLASQLNTDREDSPANLPFAERPLAAQIIYKVFVDKASADAQESGDPKQIDRAEVMRLTFRYLFEHDGMTDVDLVRMRELHRILSKEDPSQKTLDHVLSTTNLPSETGDEDTWCEPPTAQ